MRLLPWLILIAAVAAAVAGADQVAAAVGRAKANDIDEQLASRAGVLGTAADASVADGTRVLSSSTAQAAHQVLASAVQLKQGIDPIWAKDYVYYSAAAYCGVEDGLTNWTCPSCTHITPAPAKVVPLRNITAYDVYGYVALMPDQTVIIAFRGTNTSDMVNWIDDLSLAKMAIYPGCKECEVHSGFYGAWTALSAQVLAALTAFGGTSIKTIHVTGHSLGAAMAHLAAYELVIGGYTVQDIVTFGSPRVGNAAWAESYTQVVVDHNTSGIPEWMAILKQPGGVHPASATSSPVTAPSNSRVFGVISVVSGWWRGWSSYQVSAIWSTPTVPQREPAPLQPSAVLQHAVDRWTSVHLPQQPILGLRRPKIRDGSQPPPCPSISSISRSYRVVHGRDPVPHLPLLLMGFEHPPQEVWYLPAALSAVEASRLKLFDGGDSGVDSFPGEGPSPSASASVRHRSTNTRGDGGAVIVDPYLICNSTTGEDPGCSDSLIFALSIPDHLLYLHFHLGNCADQARRPAAEALQSPGDSRAGNTGDDVGSASSNRDATRNTRPRQAPRLPIADS